MDILIALFLIMNVALCGLNLITKENRYKVSDKRIANVTDLLESKGIHVNTKLDNRFDSKVGAEMQFQFYSMDVRMKLIENLFPNRDSTMQRFQANSAIVKNEPAYGYKFENKTLIFD